MDEFIKALGPAFACGLALQQLLELLDPILSRLLPDPLKKKTAISWISLGVGLALTVGAKLNILKILGDDKLSWPSVVVTALIVSTGTEGFNSLIKFVFYKKEEQKGVDPSAVNRGSGASFPLFFAGSPVGPS